MNLKEALDRLTEVIRLIQYADKSAEEIVNILHNFMILLGQTFAQRDEAQENLEKVLNQLWISHIKGSVDCTACKSHVPVDFYVGSKGISGDAVVAPSKEELIEKLEFPPLRVQDFQVPDYMPDFT